MKLIESWEMDFFAVVHCFLRIMNYVRRARRLGVGLHIEPGNLLVKPH